MKIVIHVGSGKTATTQIQRILRQNNKYLEESKVAILPLEPAGRNLKISLLSKLNAGQLSEDVINSNILRLLRSDSKDHAIKHLRSYEKQLHAYLNEVKEHAEYLVISSEQLFNFKPECIEHLSKILTPYSNEFYVIGYVRRPDLYRTSSFKNLVRNRSFYGDVFSNIGNDNIYNLSPLDWERYFQNSTVRLRVFPDSTVDKYDIIQDFFSVFGVDHNKLKVKFDIGSANVAWDYRLIRLFEIINKLQAEKSIVITEKQKERIAKVLENEESDDYEKYLPSASMALEFYKKHRCDIDRLRPWIYPDNDKFHEDFSMYPQRQKEASADDAVKLLLVALSKMAQKKSSQEKKKVKQGVVKKLLKGFTR